jgi:hypothetical protein
MKKIFLMLLLPVFLSCDKECITDLPPCINEWIEAVEKDDSWTTPAEVNEYLFNGKKVYLLTASCCDQYNILIDADCNYICSPSGGITGKGDGKCADFFAEAEHVRLIWKDSR